ncbi:hypothetical protein ABIE26_001174 [Pedobacter africanus]|uniref:Uncharacterized protein n=1 Tax=Pedobacter africanus TaxID=151894 RepID=A0ACC6KSK8_9SPHI|nr:hypothetical protein [Pedobacter africanus]MDR6782338.1 hypothetical protein [Pedobacter africanus]
MKKLFFAALVATVAVGAAFAQDAIGVQDNIYYNCTEGTEKLCSEIPQALVELQEVGFPQVDPATHYGTTLLKYDEL